MILIQHRLTNNAYLADSLFKTKSKNFKYNHWVDVWNFNFKAMSDLKVIFYST